MSALTDQFTTSPRRQQSDIEAALRTAVITTIRAKDKNGSPIYPGDPMKLGFHVWLVPRLYRFIFPYGFRKFIRRVRPDTIKKDPWLRPKLKLGGVYRIERQPPSGAVFKKGNGVIGTCIHANEYNKCLPINWEKPVRQKLLSQKDRSKWNEANLKITLGIKYDDAVLLAERYGQAAAMVITRIESGEAIGCVTIDLPHGVPLSLEDNTGTELLRQLTATRNQVQQILTRTRV